MPAITAETFSLGLNTAFDMLGQSMVIRAVTSSGTFDPETGAITDRTVSDRIVSGIESGRERKWINGELVFSDEYVFYIRAASGQTPPTGGEFIMVGSEEVAIQRADPYAIKGTDLAYRVVVVK